MIIEIEKKNRQQKIGKNLLRKKKMKIFIFLVNQNEIIYHHINEIHRNNSTHPVHIIIMMNNYILIHIIIDEEMIGMIHGIGNSFSFFT